MDLTPNPDRTSGAINRRTVLRAGAWSAPVMLLATQAPLAAASPSDDNPPPQWTFSAGTSGSSSTLGPLAPAVRINYRDFGPGFPAVAMIPWTVTVTRPGSSAMETVASGVAPVARDSEWEQTIDFGEEGMPLGYYDFVFTASGSDGSYVMPVRCAVTGALGTEPAPAADLSLALDATFRRHDQGDFFPLILTTTYTGEIAGRSFPTPWTATVIRPDDPTPIEFTRGTAYPAKGFAHEWDTNYPYLHIDDPRPTLPAGDYVFTIVAEGSDGTVSVTETVTIP